MANYSRPGVFIKEVDLPQNITLPDNGNAVGAFIGTAAKGSTAVPTLVTTWIDFIKTFGSLNDAFPVTWAAYNFFANGGKNLYVKRVVGAGSAAATITIKDRHVSPLDVLIITAKNHGEWGNELAVEIKAGGAADRFVLIITDSSGLSQQYIDLSMVVSDPRYVLSVINTLSAYVTVALALPNSHTGADLLPALTVVPGALAGGNNGSAPAASVYTNTIIQFDAIQNPLVINAPDAPYLADQTVAAAIQTAVSSYAEGRGDCFAVLDVASGLTAAAALVAAAAALGAATGAYAAAYYPWISIPNTLRATPGAVRLQAPGAAMVGQYLSTDASRGVFKAPAGIGNRLALSVATEKLLTNAELDLLNSAPSPVNAIRNIPGAGIVAMGARTLRNTPNSRYINVRRSIIYIKNQLELLSTFAVFENNDERLWSRLRTSLDHFLQSYWQAGGLRGSTTLEAYYVRCDGSINSFSDIQGGLVNIEVGVAIEYPTEFIVIKLGQLTGTASA